MKKSILLGTAIACFLGTASFASESNWETRVKKSEMTDQTNVYINTDSNDTVQGAHGFGPEGYATMYIRCQENETDVMFGFNGNFMANSQIGQNYTMMYRIDQETASTTVVDESTDNKAVFVRNPIKFTKELFGHKTLRVRISTFNDGVIETSFNIKNIENEIVEVRKACGW